MSFDQGEYLNGDPKQIMAKHGKSFYWASHLFSKKRFQDVALLYTFCRYVDDTADETHPNEAKAALESLKQEFRNPSHSLLKQVHDSFQRLGIEHRFADQLISGAQFDVDHGEIQTKKDLLIYCYQVAGVVGLMMCPVIGVNRDEAWSFALDLGIGMQITNICRDILEDAQNGRCYLPAQDLNKHGINPEDLCIRGPAKESLKAYVSQLLKLADTYYASGFAGLKFIPLRPRLAILVAGRVYQAIGHKIVTNGCEVLEGRTYLNTWEKIKVSTLALAELIKPGFWKSKKHDQNLHKALQGLPGVSAW